MGDGSSQPTPVPVPTPTHPQPPPITPEGGAGDPNPYASQTSANTGTGWTGNETPTDVDIKGIGDYAVAIKNIDDFLGDRHHVHLDLISDALTKSWTHKGAPFPEAIYAATHLDHNFKEFGKYLQNLNLAMLAIAMAAQAVADCYVGTDGWSAADVNSVDFAFGDKVSKPSGWLFTDDKTLADAMGGDGQQGSQAPVWNTVSLKTDADGTTTIVSKDQFGHLMTTISRQNPDGSTLTSVSNPDGSWTTTTSVPKPNGTLVTITNLKVPYLPKVTTVLTQNTPDGGSVTTTTENGKVTGITTVQVKDQMVPGGTARVVTTTEAGGDGKPTQSVVETTYHVNGQSGTVVMTYDKDGKLVSEVQLGAPTATTSGDTTVDQIKANAYTRDVPPPSLYEQIIPKPQMT